MVYSVETTETFERAFKKKHKDKIEWLKKAKERLQYNPEYGKPLKGRLHGIWQIRIGPFRVWYEINDVEKKVKLRAIFHKDEAIERY
ncbi:MAG: type II toxin-antitoxin system RelE/ParE family toxin [Candidatus Aenigmarchaeota archaeon]|nr:type II toxin-antitoxin system RelE/ParE family toxin [Candidatus Aenigmarchaeota archaeon]